MINRYIALKYRYRFLFMLPLLTLLISCEKDNTGNEEPVTPGVVLITSTDSIVLSEKKLDEKALTVTWTEGNNRGEGTSLSYLFKMDVADNDFQTAIPTVEVEPGVFSMSFTHEQLEKLLVDEWHKQTSVFSEIEIRVIAKVTADHFIKPEVSTIKIKVKPYAPEVIEASRVFITGDAVSNASSVEMTQTVENKYAYVYKGIFKAGKIRFPISLDANSDIVSARNPDTQVTDGTTMPVKLAEDGIDHNDFVIPIAGEYTIVVDLKDKTATFRSQATAIVSPYSHIYMIGEALPGTSKDWAIAAPLEMTQSLANPNVFTYKGALEYGTEGTNSGRIKFFVEKGSYTNDCFSPSQAARTPIVYGKANPMVLAVKGKPDYYFQLLTANVTLIVLDTKNLTVTFL